MYPQTRKPAPLSGGCVWAFFWPWMPWEEAIGRKCRPRQRRFVRSINARDVSMRPVFSLVLVTWRGRYSDWHMSSALVRECGFRRAPSPLSLLGKHRGTAARGARFRPVFRRFQPVRHARGHLGPATLLAALAREKSILLVRSTACLARLRLHPPWKWSLWRAGEPFHGEAALCHPL